MCIKLVNYWDKLFEFVSKDCLKTTEVLHELKNILWLQRAVWKTVVCLSTVALESKCKWFLYLLVRLPLSPHRKWKRWLLPLITLRDKHTKWLPWTSDQPVAHACTCTIHNTHKRETSMPSVGIRTHNPCKRAAVDPHIRPYGDHRVRVDVCHSDIVEPRQTHLVFQLV